VKSGGSDPAFVPPDAGTVLEFLAITHKLTSRQTGGAYYMFESTFEPGTGNGLHVHHREIEIGYVLEGALEVRLGDRSQVLETGGVAHLPTNVAHAIRNPLATSSRYLFMTIPGGLDRWFDALADAKAHGLLDDATYRRLALDYGIEWLE
jgi:quercetin dioxygenase-like cupin family protein